MTLIKRYIHAVGLRLPAKTRRDIAKELESLVMDALEARVGQGSQYTEDDVVAVLQEFGPPEEVAARYAPTPQYLIGPRLFPVYRLVASIVMGATLLGLSISFVISIIIKDPSARFMTQFLSFAGSIFSGLLSAFGSVTIAFAIMERVLPDATVETIKLGEPWDPRKLPLTTDLQDWGSIPKLWISLGLTVVVMLAFNLFPQRIGIYYRSATEWNFLVLISPQAVRAYLRLWNVVWLLTIVHYTILLIRREWSLGSRILELVVELGSVVVLVAMVRGVSLIDTAAMLTQFNVGTTEVISKVAAISDKGLRFAFTIAAIVITIETVVKAVKLLRAGRQQAA